MEAMQLFNPSNQTEQELVANFTIRKKEFNRILNTVKDDKMKNAPQHFIIQGVRGSGKTTLLLRSYYEIKSNESLNSWLIPLIFSEEQYGVNKLFKFWEQVAMELESESDNYSGLVDQMQESEEVDGYEEHCYQLLFESLKEHKNKICVLMDNIGDFLNKLSKKEQQRLREVLITNNQIRIIGASSEVLEASYKYDEPFYEYFKIVHLQALKKEEVKSFLLTLEEINKTTEIQQIIKETPGRIEALRTVTGGIPRTIVLLYEIFINDHNGDSFKQLEILLDRVTPLYKHRMDDLSSQQQEIVDCIALNWDAIAVKEIARKTRMESKAVSAQLRLLEKNNVVIKKTTTTKNHLYQVKERFFNIWYIMRNGRKSDKNKVKWLTKFIEMWCDKGSLNRMVDKHLAKLKSGKIYDKYAFSLTEVYSTLLSAADKQHELLKATAFFLKSTKSELVNELSKSDLDYVEQRIDPLIKNSEHKKAIELLLNRNTNTGVTEFYLATIYESLGAQRQAEKYYLQAIKRGVLPAFNNLAIFYDEVMKNASKSEKYFLLAIKNGSVEALFNIALLYDTRLEKNDSAEKYYLLAVKNGDIEAINNLAILYHKKFLDFVKAEKYYKLAIKKGRIITYHNLAMLYKYELKNYTKAEKCYLLAIEDGYNDSLRSLAHLYEKQIKKFNKAEQYYLLAAEKKVEGALNNLALLYENKFENYKNAEKYFLLSIDENDLDAIYNIALFYKNKIKDYKNAEKYFLMSINNGSYNALNNLALLYEENLKDNNKAEKYYLLSVKNGDPKASYNLALFYEEKINDYDKAKKYFLLAAKNGYPKAYVNIALLYSEHLNQPKKAEKYYQLGVDNNDEDSMNALAFNHFLAISNKKTAEKLIKKAHNINQSSMHIRHTYAVILLWNGDIDKALEISKFLFQSKKMNMEALNDLELLTNLLIAKKQYNFVYKLFEQNNHQLKDRLKPIYYALMHFMQDKYPDEIKKMGEELKETVESVIQQILELRVKYK